MSTNQCNIEDDIMEALVVYNKVFLKAEQEGDLSHSIFRFMGCNEWLIITNGIDKSRERWMG